MLKKKIFFVSLVVLTFLLICQPLYSFEVADITTELKNHITKQVQIEYPDIVTSDIKINILNAQQLQKIPTAAASYKINFSPIKKIIGQLVLGIYFYDINHTYLEKKSIILEIDAYANYLLSSRIIYAQEVFTAKDIKQKKLSIKNKPLNCLRFSKEVLGKQALATIGQNNLILKWMVKDIPLVKKGDSVQVKMKNKNIELTFLGKALSEGRKGDIIKIKSLDYKKILKGEIIDSKNVQIPLNY
ncbi:flagellar basal body P-ring formation protein FlgA [bacterium]|nr:flagellar basal body P-ring formation protein FlgA [bacterium]